MQWLILGRLFAGASRHTELRRQIMAVSEQRVAQRQSSRRGWSRWLLALAAALGLVAASLWGIVWWEERPLRRAVALLESGEGRRALAEVEGFISDHGSSDRALAIRARALVASGRPAEAIRLFERVGPGEAADVRACAQAYLMVEQWTLALPLLEWCAQRQSDDPDVLYELASCRARLGQLDEALESAREFTRHAEHPHRGWVLIGTLLRDKGNNTGAAEAWSRVEEFDPDFDDLQVPAEQFLTQFAKVELEMGNPSRASELVQTALGMRETAEAHYQLGAAEEQLGNQATAEKHWRRALEMDPGHLSARESVARLAISAGDAGRAEDILSPVLDNMSLRSSTAYLMQRAAHLRGDGPTAEMWRERTEALRKKETINSSISQILRESPDSYWGRVVRCYQFAEQANWEQAEAVLKGIPAVEQESEFVAKLKHAVRTRAPLPSTDLLPLAPF